MFIFQICSVQIFTVQFFQIFTNFIIINSRFEPSRFVRSSFVPSRFAPSRFLHSKFIRAPVIISEKNKTITMKYGYKFRFLKMLNNDVQRWTCCKNTCKCFFKRHNGVDTEIYNDHKHDKPIEQDINRQKLSNNLKKKAVEEISVLPSKLICCELKNSDTHTLNDTSLIKKI